MLANAKTKAEQQKLKKQQQKVRRFCCARLIVSSGVCDFFEFASVGGSGGCARGSRCLSTFKEERRSCACSC